jgi:CRP-like cAMP-binding protein
MQVRRKEFGAGQFLAAQGASAHTIFYIEEGVCEIYHGTRSNKDQDFISDSEVRAGGRRTDGQTDR